jgi:protein phosphatase
MRLAVLSDIHGNLPALEAVLQDIHSHTHDGILVAGDLVGGPLANETIALLGDIQADMIRGNSDINLLRYDRGDAPPPWRTSKQFAVLRWFHRDLRQPSLERLRGLPEERVIDAGPTSLIRVVHGSPGAPFEGLDPIQEPEPFAWRWSECGSQFSSAGSPTSRESRSSTGSWPSTPVPSAAP